MARGGGRRTCRFGSEPIRCEPILRERQSGGDLPHSCGQNISLQRTVRGPGVRPNPKQGRMGRSCLRRGGKNERCRLPMGAKCQTTILSLSLYLFVDRRVRKLSHARRVGLRQGSTASVSTPADVKRELHSCDGGNLSRSKHCSTALCMYVSDLSPRTRPRKEKGRRRRARGQTGASFPPLPNEVRRQVRGYY